MVYYKDIPGIKALGKKVREIRKSKKLSQEQLANLCDLSFSQINRIESGAINTSVSHIFLIATHLEVHPMALFDFKYPPSENEE